MNSDMTLTVLNIHQKTPKGATSKTRKMFLLTKRSGPDEKVREVSHKICQDIHHKE